jgi:hypothetical protein
MLRGAEGDLVRLGALLNDASHTLSQTLSARAHTSRHSCACLFRDPCHRNVLREIHIVVEEHHNVSKKSQSLRQSAVANACARTARQPPIRAAHGREQLTVDSPSFSRAQTKAVLEDIEECINVVSLRRAILGNFVVLYLTLAELLCIQHNVRAIPRHPHVSHQRERLE